MNSLDGKAESVGDWERGGEGEEEAGFRGLRFFHRPFEKQINILN